MFLRLEVVEEMEEEKKKNINEKTNLKEFFRSVYFKHYKKWSALTICVFLGKIPSRSPLKTENLPSSNWRSSAGAQSVESTLWTPGFVVPHSRGESLRAPVLPPLRQPQSEAEGSALYRVGEPGLLWGLRERDLIQIPLQNRGGLAVKTWNIQERNRPEGSQQSSAGTKPFLLKTFI